MTSSAPTRFGAEAFAERACRELLATGETARQRIVDARDLLTPQEAHIARWRARDTPTPRLAPSCSSARARSSTTCVRVFPNLDVTSRKELRYAFDQDAQDDLGPGPVAAGPDAGI